MAEDLAVVESDPAVGESRHLGIVGDHDNGVALVMQVGQQVGDDLLVGGVKVSSGLVGQQDGRVIDESPGDADALLLAAGELTGGDGQLACPVRRVRARSGLRPRRSWNGSIARA